MDFKQAKVATSPSPAYARTAQGQPQAKATLAKGAGPDPVGVSPTTQSIADTFNFVATKGSSPAFDPSSDPLRALRAAINGSAGLSPDITIPTVDQILKEVDKTGNSLVDGTLAQQYEDLKLIYTTEKLALEDKVARGTATAQDVKDLKKFTALLTTINVQLDEINQRQPIQRAVYQQEIDAVKAFGIKHADKKYHTISQEKIAEYDLNGDGIIGNPLAGSALYTGVVIGTQTIEGKENYSFLDSATMLTVRFDPVTGEALATGISNPNQVWDLSKSGLVNGKLAKDGQYVNGAGVTGFTQNVDVAFGIQGTFLGNRKAFKDSANAYNVQADIPIPETIWTKTYPDGTDITHEINGWTKFEPWLEGIETGELKAPPEEQRDDYRQVQVVEAKLSSEKLSGGGGNHVLTLLDAEGQILLTMGIYGTSDVGALGEMGKRLLAEPDDGYIPASSFSLALSAGYDLGNSSLGDPHRMRKSPVKLTVEESYISSTNGGVFRTANFSGSGKDYLDRIKKNPNHRVASQDSLAFFTNGTDSARYIGAKVTKNASWETEAYGKNTAVHEQTWTEDKQGAEFELNQVTGPMAMGLRGNLRMGQYNSVVEEGPPPKNTDHLDAEWTSLVDLGGGYNVFVGKNGNHHIRNATYVDIQGNNGDLNYIQVSQSIAWEAQRELTTGDPWNTFAEQGKEQTVIYRDNPAVYVRVNTPGGKTVIDNDGETMVNDNDLSGSDKFLNGKGEAVAPEYDIYNSMSKFGPGSEDNLQNYRDDKYELNTGDYEFVNVEEIDLPSGAKQNSKGFDGNALLDSYVEAEKAFEEFIGKDPAVLSEGEALEGEAAWEIYGPNYAAAQESVTNFFDQYRDQFGSSVPLDPSLDPGADPEQIDQDLEKKMGSAV